MNNDIEQVSMAITKFSAVEAGLQVLREVNAASRKRPSDAEIVAAVARAFSVTETVAAGWLSTIREAA